MKDACRAREGAPHRCLAKRIGIAILGGTITLIGLAMIVLPGPAIVAIPIGLSILATEFLWARRYLRKTRELATRLKEKASTMATPPRRAAGPEPRLRARRQGLHRAQE